jgi:hypothetical protein
MIGGLVWFQGLDDKLFAMRGDGSNLLNPGRNWTASTPFVSYGLFWVYPPTPDPLPTVFFQGADNTIECECPKMSPSCPKETLQARWQMRF